MKLTTIDRCLLARLAALLRHVDPVPPSVLADAMAAGFRLVGREPRLSNQRLDRAWLLPLGTQ